MESTVIPDAIGHFPVLLHFGSPMGPMPVMVSAITPANLGQSILWGKYRNTEPNDKSQISYESNHN